MGTAWRHFGAPRMHFWSHDFINVIFGKTAITPSIFKLKTSNQLKLPRTKYRVRPIVKSAHFCAETGKKSLNTIDTKILTCYINKGAR